MNLKQRIKRHFIESSVWHYWKRRIWRLRWVRGEGRVRTRMRRKDTIGGGAITRTDSIITFAEKFHSFWIKLKYHMMPLEKVRTYSLNRSLWSISLIMRLNYRYCLMVNRVSKSCEMRFWVDSIYAAVIMYLRYQQREYNVISTVHRRFISRNV